MSNIRRTVRFQEDIVENEDDRLERAFSETDSSKKMASLSTRFREKHSLDSDEEDNVEPDDRLRCDDIEGQEETNVDIEEGVRFTPFNMREELEEGHFDSQGMYIFNKNKGQIKDSWMDDIDWLKVKQMEKSDVKSKLASESSDSDDAADFDELQVYRDMLAMMRPAETVLKAITRLGGEDGKKGLVKKRTQCWKSKKSSDVEQHGKRRRDLDGMNDDGYSVKRARMSSATEVVEVNSVGIGDANNADGSVAVPSSATGGAMSSENAAQSSAQKIEESDLLRLIGFADSLLARGDMEIYQCTYEKLAFRVKLSDKTGAKAADLLTTASEFDMFSDEADVKKTAPHVSQESVAQQSTADAAVKAGEIDELLWEYKWTNTEDADIHGPFTSEQMLQWTREDYFADGVFVRKTNSQDNRYYSSKRIDFELYCS